jgi:hypothetical protein
MLMDKAKELHNKITLLQEWSFRDAITVESDRLKLMNNVYEHYDGSRGSQPPVNVTLTRKVRTTPPLQSDSADNSYSNLSQYLIGTVQAGF